MLQMATILFVTMETGVGLTKVNISFSVRPTLKDVYKTVLLMRTTTILNFFFNYDLSSCHK